MTMALCPASRSDRKFSGLRRSLAVLTVFLLGGALSTARAETIEEVEKQVTDLSKNVKSLAADLRVTTELSPQARSIINAKVEQLLDDGKYYATMYGTLEKAVGPRESPKREREEFLEVTDGRFKWRQEQIRDKYVVFKYPATDAPAIGGRLFSELQKQHKLDLAADDSVDGERCWVVIAVPRTPPEQEDPVSTGRVVYYIRKKDGVVAKTDMFRPGDHKPFIINHYSNIQVNPKIQRSHFQYQPPEGVQVIDETQPAPQGG